MNSTAFLIGKAAAQALATIGLATAGPGVQPAVWATALDTPPQMNLFFTANAAADAQAWQASHWGDFDATVMTDKGSVSLDGSAEDALILTARVKMRGNAQMRYVIPFVSQGAHISVYPMLVFEHATCAFASTEIETAAFGSLQAEVDSYGPVALTFIPPSAAQEQACNRPVNV